MTEEKPKLETIDANRIFVRINDIERHLVNLISPIQELNKLVGSGNKIDQLVAISKTPFIIDDAPLKKMSEDITKLNGNLTLYGEKTNLNALIGAFTTLHSLSYRVEQMDKKLDLLVDIVQQISSKGLRAKLDFTIGEEPEKETLISSTKRKMRRRT